MTVTEELALIRKYLRIAVNILIKRGATLPVDLAQWWAEEQQRVTAEAAAEAARKTARQQFLTAEIVKLQAELDLLK